MTERLSLKWGTVKGWSNLSERSQELLRKYADQGWSMSAAMQQDTPEQKAALCELIDSIDGKIHNDWSGKTMSKGEAKKYVMEYRQS